MKTENVDLSIFKKFYYPSIECGSALAIKIYDWAFLKVWWKIFHNKVYIRQQVYRIEWKNQRCPIILIYHK